MSENKVRDFIRQAVREVLAEMTATGNVAGFETPFAFTGGKAAGEKRRKEAAVNSTGFMIVDDFEDGEDKADSRSVEERDKSFTEPLENRKKNIKVGSRKSLEEALSHQEADEAISKILVGVERGIITPTLAARAIRKIVADQEKALKEDLNPVEKNQLAIAKRTLKMNDPIAGVMGGISKAEAEKIIKRLTAKLNEGKYHQWRNDESLKPRQKIGRSIREVNELLSKIEESISMSQRLKEEAGVQTSDYWKRTNSALLKIENKLVRITNKLKQVR